MFGKHIKNDIEHTFFREFCETAVINTAEILVMIDNDKLDYKLNSNYKNFDGLMVGDVLFYINKDEYKKIPNMKERAQAGQALIFNGKHSVITSVVDNMRVLEIVLQYVT